MKKNTEITLDPIDVGFDLKLQKMPVQIDAETQYDCKYRDHSGELEICRGTGAEIAKILEGAGYIIRLRTAA